MKASKSIRQLINDAKEAGYTVAERTTSCTIQIGKTVQSVGIRICQDGNAIRSDADLDVCTTIRTVKMMREILRLSK